MMRLEFRPVMRESLLANGRLTQRLRSHDRNGDEADRMRLATARMAP